MALAIISEGSLLTDGTEQTVLTDTTGKLYVPKLDVSALVRGRDFLVVRAKTIVRSGGAEGLANIGYGVYPKGSDQIAYGEPIPADISYKLTMQLTGTNQTIPWSVLSLGQPTNIAEGTSTPGNTLTSLTSQTASHAYMFAIDTSAMANGDELLVQVNDEVRSTGGTERVVYQAYYKNVQATQIKYCPPVPANVLCEVKIQQTLAPSSNKSFPWKLLALG